MALQSAQIGQVCKTVHRGSHVSFEDACLFLNRGPQDQSLIGRSLRDSVAHRKYRDAIEEVFLLCRSKLEATSIREESDGFSCTHGKHWQAAKPAAQAAGPCLHLWKAYMCDNTSIRHLHAPWLKRQQALRWLQNADLPAYSICNQCLRWSR